MFRYRMVSEQVNANRRGSGSLPCDKPYIHASAHPG